MNKVILVGHTGKDPEIRNLEGGARIAKFSFATSYFHKDTKGEKVTDVDWHNISAWDNLADFVMKFVKKGTSLAIEGNIKYRSYEKEGVTKYYTEIVANSIEFAGKKDEPKPLLVSDVPIESSVGKVQPIPGTNKVKVQSMSDIDELPGNVANYDNIPDDDDLPF